MTSLSKLGKKWHYKTAGFTVKNSEIKKSDIDLYELKDERLIVCFANSESILNKKLK